MQFAAMLTLLSIGLAGAWLLAAGLRGRRINDHPVCRACRFDLDGVYPVAPRCPECGGSLESSRAVRDGARRRRRVPLLLGAMLLITAIGATGFAGWTVASGTAWYGSAPGWYLEFASGVGPQRKRAAAVGELVNRQLAGTLDEDRFARLVRRGLEQQRDPGAVWLVEWGDLIDAADAAGGLSPGQRDSYLRNACSFTLHVRDRVREGEEARVSLAMIPTRVGSATDLVLTTEWDELRAGEVVLDTGLGGESRFMTRGTGGRSANMRTIPFELPVGTVELTLSPRVRIGTAYRPGSAWGEIEDPIELRPELTTGLEVVPAGTTLVRFIDRPEIAPEMRAAIGVRSLEVRARGAGWVELSAELFSDGPPESFGFDAFVIDTAGVEHPLATIYFPAGTSHSHATMGRVEAELGSSVDLVLRASEGAVLHASESDETWAGEIRVEAVPLTDPSAIGD